MLTGRSPFTLIDLFAGAGGLSEGLREVGYNSLYANEVVRTYAATYVLNHPGTTVDPRDIREVDPRDIRADLNLLRGELDLIAGGPPCQGFSINAPERRADDHRNQLFREYLRFVEEFRPKAALIENVPGLVSFGGGTTLAAILESLDMIGYSADVRILYAPYFGVPQSRWRTFIIGLRDTRDVGGAFPEPQYSAPARVNFTSSFQDRNIVPLPSRVGLERHTTVVEAIGDLPPLASGEKGELIKDYSEPPQGWFQTEMRAGSPGVLNHEAPRLGAINLERMKHIPPGGNWTDIPHDLLPRGMREARLSDHTKRYGRVRPDGLASTILTKCDPHWGAYFHYDQERSFTVREAARIQSFPDHYEFTGSKVAQYEQVGNAVPPLLARAVGASISSVIALAHHNSSIGEVG